MAEGDVAPPTPPAWHTGIEPEVTQLWANKKWDATDPAKLAVAVSQSYVQAEKVIGTKAENVIRLPENMATDTAAMQAIWRRLGAPNEAKEYDFPALKDKDGKVIDSALDTTLRENFLKLNVPKSTAAEIAALVRKFDVDKQTAAATDKAAALAAEKVTLSKNWGANEPANKVIAQSAARALGMTPEQVQALENTVGYASTMEMLRNIGTQIGEDKFIRPADGKTGVQSIEGAKERKAELMKDTAWRKRYLDGDSAAVKEMTQLNTIIVDNATENF